MRIAVFASLSTALGYNAFVRSFKNVNTQHDYTFILTYEGDKPNTLADIEIPAIKNSYQYIKALHDILNDYDRVILARDSIFCVRSIDNLITDLQFPEGLSVCSSVLPIRYSNEQYTTNGEFYAKGVLDNSIIFSFAIINKFDLLSAYEEFAEAGLDGVSVGMIIGNRYQYICANEKLCLYHSPTNDSLDYYTVDMELDMLFNNDGYIIPAYYYLPQYREFLDTSHPLHPQIDLRLELYDQQQLINLFYIEYYRWYNFNNETITFE